MTESNPPSLPEAIQELIQGYHEVNGPVEEFQGSISLGDVLRHIRLNRPFVVRNGCSDWPSTQWDAAYLRERMGSRRVRVAETPFGNADSAATAEDGSRVFVKPFEQDQPFSSFLSSLQATTAKSDDKGAQCVFYSQAQNDNLRSEYLPLFQDVPPSISEMSAALGREPDAINFWLGDSSSVTSLHRDNYENIYAQIRGSKTFVLLSPLEAACVNEQFLPCATYTKKENTWYIVLDEPDGKVPVALWDPDNPEENATEFTKFSQPLRIRLEEGDLLYLPACWYHKVIQESSTEGFSCSVNYWYDMDFDGSFNPATSFIRHVAWAANR